eukprot:gene27720-7366_t
MVCRRGGTWDHLRGQPHRTPSRGHAPPRVGIQAGTFQVGRPRAAKLQAGRLQTGGLTQTRGLKSAPVPAQHARQRGNWHERKLQLLATTSVINLNRVVSVMSQQGMECASIKSALQHLIHLLGKAPPSSGIERQLVINTAQTLTACIPPIVSSLSAQDVAAITCSLAKLRHVDWDVLQLLMDASYELMPDMTLNSASSMMWAFQRSYVSTCDRFNFEFKFPLPSEWIAALADVLLKDLEQCSPTDLSMTLTTMSHMSHRQPVTWWSQVCDLVYRKAEQFTGAELSRVVHALAVMQVRPSEEWLSTVLGRIERNMHSLNSSTPVHCLLRALLWMQYRPEASWMEKLMLQVQKRMSTFDLKSMSQLLLALSRMQYQPSSRWSNDFQKYTMRSLSKAESSSQTARAHATILCAFSKLRLQPTTDWLRNMAHLASSFMPLYTTKELVMVIWSQQRLGHDPDDDAMSEVQRQVSARKNSLTNQQAMTVLVALSRFTQKWKARKKNK